MRRQKLTERKLRRMIREEMDLGKEETLQNAIENLNAFVLEDLPGAKQKAYRTIMRAKIWVEGLMDLIPKNSEEWDMIKEINKQLYKDVPDALDSMFSETIETIQSVKRNLEDSVKG